MTMQSLSRRTRLVFVVEEIGLGITLLQLSHTERSLGEREASDKSLERSHAACQSARRSLGEVSCLLQSPRAMLESSIDELQAAILEHRGSRATSARTLRLRKASNRSIAAS
jgi:hypothetical protein